MPVAGSPTRSACSRTKLACLYEAYPKPIAAVPPMPRPHRLLVVMPSWVGDAVMATPSLRLLRTMLPGAFIGALVRPGLDELLAGLETIDELHVERSVGVMGPKRVAGAVRPRRYDAALLLTNSFSSALIARLAGVPTRIGYDRDGRGFLLTGRLTPVKRRDLEPFSRSPSDPGGWAPVPACVYYWHAASALLAAAGCDPAPASRMGPMELAVTPDQLKQTESLMARAGLAAGERFVVLNPGGNDAAKRWPIERFGALAAHLFKRHALRPVVNGSPGERELAAAVASCCPPESRCVSLPEAGVTLASLKGLVGAARLMVTNDTGPRHIAAATGVPVVSLFGPTDHRWTIIPARGDSERVLVADPSLPEEEVANDHPERCAVARITVESVVAACDSLLVKG